MKIPATVLGVGVLVCISGSALAGQRDGDHGAAVARLTARPEIIQALDLARDLEAGAESDLIELTEIPAPPFGEAARAARFAEMLQVAGLPEVSIDDVGNVIARRAGLGAGETVAIVAHLDTVFPAGTDVTPQSPLAPQMPGMMTSWQMSCGTAFTHGVPGSDRQTPAWHWPTGHMLEDALQALPVVAASTHSPNWH